jgi:hypothetical protein
MRNLVKAVIAGVLLECALVAWFIKFPVGPCNEDTALFGYPVVVLHFPGLIIAETIFGLHFGPGQMIVAVVITALIWIACFLAFFRWWEHRRVGRQPSGHGRMAT